ncbi:unnamed protein product [Schistosoma margrebowiei]|uniref:Uncharacterized protein n=2 Tax=Schistosoma TaxID=6181 RepID=A0A3P7W0E9_9TREM|nr:unnamed protein product [Schistosoma margrebowiei]
MYTPNIGLMLQQPNRLDVQLQDRMYDIYIMGYCLKINPLILNNQVCYVSMFVQGL